jgi:large subunit ribosomal protein L29
MRIEALRDLTSDELLQKREELMQELFNLNLRRGFSELDNPLKLRTLRRDLARIETILTEDRRGIRKIVDQSGLLINRSQSKGDKK